MDLSLVDDTLVVYTNTGTDNHGISGDGQHPVIVKFSISAPATFQEQAQSHGMVGWYDVCDTTTIVEDHIYISCGFMDYAAIS